MDELLLEIKERLLKEEDIIKLSNLFKKISDPTRIKILFALKNNSLSVTELATILDMTHSSISHQLKILRDSNLVTNKKNGKEVIYSLSDSHVHTIFNQAIEHVEEEY